MLKSQSRYMVNVGKGRQYIMIDEMVMVLKD